jgi:hypothetical protein
MRADTDWDMKSKMVGHAGKDGGMLGRIDRCGCPHRLHADTFTHGGGMSEAVTRVDIAGCAPQRRWRSSGLARRYRGGHCRVYIRCGCPCRFAYRDDSSSQRPHCCTRAPSLLHRRRCTPSSVRCTRRPLSADFHPNARRAHLGASQPTPRAHSLVRPIPPLPSSAPACREPAHYTSDERHTRFTLSSPTLPVPLLRSAPYHPAA